MRIEVVADESIGGQARTYAEYRLFAVVSDVIGTSRVRRASLVLDRAKHWQHCDRVVCRITVEWLNRVIKVRAAGNHPYGAINRAVDRLRLNLGPAQRNPPGREALAS